MADRVFFHLTHQGGRAFSFKKLARGGNVENSRRQRLSYSFETQIDGKRYAITTDDQGRLLKKELQQDENEDK